MSYNRDESWWAAEFPGKHTEVPDAIMCQHWPMKERRAELALMGMKWWDYRMCHPVIATYFFSHILTQETRIFIREHIDNTPARVTASGREIDWNPIKSGDVFDHSAVANSDYLEKKVLGLIRARQAADRDGIPYVVFIRAALEYYYVGPGSYMLSRFPRNIIPTFMLYNEQCLDFIRQRWLETVQTRMQVARHPRYLASNDDGHFDHLGHRNWIVQQLRLKNNPKIAAQRMCELGLLTQTEVSLFK